MALFIIAVTSILIVCVGIFIARTAQYVNDVLTDLTQVLNINGMTRNTALDNLVKLQERMLEVSEREAALAQAVYELQREMLDIKLKDRETILAFNRAAELTVPAEVLNAYGVTRVDELPDEVREIYSPKEEVR